MKYNCSDLDDKELSEMMQKIKYNLNKRNGDLIPLSNNASNLGNDQKSSVTFDQDLAFIWENSNICNESYIIESHRHVFGSFLIKGRNLVNGEIKRYLGPIIRKQSIFNGTLVRIISEIKMLFNQITEKIEHLEFSINSNTEKIEHLEFSINSNTEKIEHLEFLINENNDKIKSEIMQSVEVHCSKYDEFIERNENTKWSELYSKDITEKNLMENIEYHSYFIDLIRHYAQISANSKIPKLIEIGLGNGTMSVFFSRNELYDVYGIDNDIDVLGYCINNNKKFGGYAKFLLIDAFDLGILNKKQFDVAFSQGTLEHFDNNSIIELISNQLKIASYVIFSVPSINWGTREIGNERKMTLEEWRTLLNEGEFKILNLEYYKDDLHIVCVLSE